MPFLPLIAAGLIAVFKKVWVEFWGPRMEHILRHSLLTLLEAPGSPLLDVPRLLTDRTFRQPLVGRLTDRRVEDFWLTEFEKYSPYFRSEAVAPILNKVGSFLASPVIRQIVGQRESAFRLREVMDQRKILVVNLSKGRLGEEASALLGALLITGFHLAALRRSDLPEEERRDFYLYIDEVHTFATLSLTDILQEARKYRLNLILAHQYLDQLDERIQRALLGNVGTLVVFRAGVRDAEVLAKEFWPDFGVGDLVSLPRYQIYLRLMIDGIVSKPFSGETLPPSGQAASLQ